MSCIEVTVQTHIKLGNASGAKLFGDPSRSTQLKAKQQYKSCKEWAIVPIAWMSWMLWYKNG